MITANNITGDSIITKVTSDKYRSNWDTIFGKPKEQKPDITVLEACDGFTLTINKSGIQYRFSQDESIAGLVDFFTDLGYTANYEEDY